MKKPLALLMLIILLPISSHASLVRFEIGTSLWIQSIDGDLCKSVCLKTGDAAVEGASVYGANGLMLQKDLNYAAARNMGITLTIEHDHDMLPMVKLSHQELAFEKAVTPVNALIWGTQTIKNNVQFASAFQYKMNDITMYWRLPDNDWQFMGAPITFDTGFTIRQPDGYFKIAQSNYYDRTDIQSAYPIFYLAMYTRLWHPQSFSAIEINASPYQGSHHRDLSFRIGYQAQNGIDSAIGYRVWALDMVDVEDLYSEIFMEGLFADIRWHF